MATLLPEGKQSFETNAGTPLVGGKVYTYDAGTNNPRVTYQDAVGTIPNTNPIILDARGEATIFWQGNYKVVLRDALDNVIWTVDNVSGVSGIDLLSSAGAGMIGFLYAAVYAGGTIGKWLQDLALAAGSTFIGWIQAGFGAVTRTISDKLRDSVSVLDFMTPAQITDYKTRALTLDLTAPFQAAIDSLSAGDELDLCSGAAKITAALTVNADGITIRGRGYKTQIITNHLTADIFTVGNLATEVTGLIFRNFRVWSSVVKTGGYAFNCRQISNSRWENVYAGSLKDYVAAGNSHRLWDGYYFDRFSENVVVGGQCVVAQTAIKTRGNADQSFGAELLLDGNFRIVFAGLRGVWMGGASGGVYLARCDLSVCRTGVYCDDTLQPGIPNRELFIQDQCTIDSCTGWGLSIESNGLSTLDAPNIWVSGCGSIATGEGGIRIAPTTGVDVSAIWGSVRIQNCYYDGMQLNSGIHNISGGFIRSNGTGAAGGHGILIAAAAVSGFNCANTFIHNNGNGTRGYGISNDAVGVTYSIQGNYLFGNGQGPIRNAAGITIPVNQLIRNNIGYVSENSAISVIANGTSSLVVNHGLSETPTCVVLSLAGTPDVSPPYAAVADFTATQFTIRTAANVTANRPIAWRAVRGAE